MRTLSRILRLIKINFVLVRYNLDEVIITSWFTPFRFFTLFNPWYWLHKNKLTRAQRIRLAIEELGPIFIKAGQILSTRRDLLPDDIADELAKLQDNVPPFPGVIAKRMIEDSLNKKMETIFLAFDPNPIASASIAQVHAITLYDHTNAVVKVLRPGIRSMIARDLDVLYMLGNLANRYWDQGRQFKPREIVDEIATTLYDELDLQREGANASALKRNFLHSSLLYIPEIIWPYSRANVLVMERIYGIPIQRIELLNEHNINLKRLAERCLELFFTQVFRDSFFHADMHPGNIFVSTKNPEDPQIILVDFGIMGSLNSKDKRYIAENMLAFFKRDYQKVAELHIASGWLPVNTRIDQFEGAIRAVCEPIFERPANEISFGQLLLRLFQTARRFHINIQPQLILLQKTLLNVEGVAAQLFPELDMWAIAKPYIDKWVRQQVGPRAFLRKVNENLPYWGEKLPDLPGLIYETLTEHKYHLERKRDLTDTHANTSVTTHNASGFFMGAGVGCLLAIVLLFLNLDAHQYIFTLIIFAVMLLLIDAISPN